MAYQRAVTLPVDKVSTPSYIVEEPRLIENLRTLSMVRERTGCTVILALKAFSMFSVFPIIRQYLDGTTASSLHEAHLGAEEFGKQVHVYAPAYREEEFPMMCRYADHITFNSVSQWQQYRSYIRTLSDPPSCGLRINPEHSTAPCAMYDPCAPFSRFGVTAAMLEGQDIEGITGLHFHTLCEQNSDALQSTLEAVEERFGNYLSRMQWLNFGGGHHITRSDYDVDRLCRLIERFRDAYDLKIILEPGEAVALNAGVLVASVLDIMHNEMDIAILDTSAATHMPDVLEMPYRPNIVGAGEAGAHPYTYRLAGNTCLSGDVIGDYSFREPLRPGSKLIFLDMAHYTMVKNNTFNGVNLPSIGVYTTEGEVRIVKSFGYEDFKSRLS